MSLIYLDMDGVLANFHKSACEVHRRELDSPKNWNWMEEWGVTADQFWDPINARGVEFWSQLEPYDWAEDLVAMVRYYGNLVICTSPSLSPYCVSGKLLWLQRFFGRKFRDYVFTPRKHYVATPGSVLIDDSDDHIQKFTSVGGNGIVFPQSWNSQRVFAEVPLERVADALETMKSLGVI